MTLDNKLVLTDSLELALKKFQQTVRFIDMSYTESRVSTKKQVFQ